MDERLFTAADFLVVQGYVHMEHHELDEAMSSFSRAIDQDPFLADAYLGRAMAREASGLDVAGTAECLRDYTRCIICTEDRQRAPYKRRGLIYFNLRRYTEALEDMDKALLSFPYHSEIWYYRGRILYSLDREREAAEAFTAALRYAEKPEADCYYWRGQCYLAQSETDEACKDFQQAVWLNPAHAEASFALGYMMINHWETDTTQQEGLSLIHKAATLQYAPAMRVLSDEYESGRLMRASHTASILWLRRSAESGDKQSCLKWGVKLLKGDGVPQDSEKAVRFLLTAMPHPLAYSYLGSCYETGTGVTQSFEKAFAYMSVAAAAQVEYARLRLGLFHFHGLGTEQDRKTALQLLEPLAETRGEAAWLVSRCYSEGKGVRKNRKKAAQYAQLAQALGYEAAIRQDTE